MATESTKLLLKDQLFNKEKVKHLTHLIKNVYPKLNQIKFEKDILERFSELELKARISWIREIIETYLPKDYEETLSILIKSLENRSEVDDFIFAPYSEYVAVNGCNKKHLTKSLWALGEFTKHCSAEFAIRDFINKFPEETFTKMQEWSVSKNIHQKRLASEGLRPKLPWAKSINFDYKRGSTVLDNLFYDKNRYITRSVANHMNDISKIDLDFVINKLEEWKTSKKQNNKEIDYVINHSLRTSIKKGHETTFKFLGHDTSAKVIVNNLTIKEKKIFIGESLEFSFKIIAKNDANLIIDYKIIYPTPNGRHSEKTFKIKKVEMANNENKLIEKSHLFKRMTTKKLYSGEYKLEIQINGKVLDSATFYLKV